VVTTLTGAFANAALFDYEPKRVSAGVCAIGGGIVGGLIGHHLIGKDPVTAILAIVGGAIGYDYCTNYVNNPRYQAIKDLIKDGFGKRPGPRSFRAESDDFFAGISILRYGTKSGLIRDRNCVEFETSVYRRSGQFMGRVQPLWACDDEWGNYEIMRSSHGIYVVTFSESVQVGVGGSHNSGSSAGTYARLSRRWKKLDYSQLSIREVTDYRQDPRTGKRVPYKRPVRLVNRSGEYGFFGGRRQIQDGYYGIKMPVDIAMIGSDLNYAPTVFERDVGIECHVELNYCENFEVRNVKFYDEVLKESIEVNGTARYIFPNGDMFINDSNGNIILPKEYL
jgi:hypothetical protein